MSSFIEEQTEKAFGGLDWAMEMFIGQMLNMAKLEGVTDEQRKVCEKYAPAFIMIHSEFVGTWNKFWAELTGN